MNEGRTIINVAHIDQTLYDGIIGRFIVPGRGKPHAETRPYGVLVIPERLSEPDDKGWGESGEHGRNIHYHDGKKFALSIIDDYQRSLGNRPDLKINMGLCLIAGETPTQEELDRTTKEYHDALDLFFLAGQDAWNRHHNIRAIDDRSKLAVRVLGKECEWAERAPSVARIPCPNCAELVPVTLAIHRRTSTGDECGWVLDPEKAKKLLGAEPQADKQRRLPKTEAMPGAGL